MNISPAGIFRISFLISLSGFAVALALFILSCSSGGPGQANSDSLSVTGSGFLDVGHWTDLAHDRAITQAAQISYKGYREWGKRWSEGDHEFTTEFLVLDAIWGEYTVEVSGSGHKVIYAARNFTGDYEGSGLATVTISEQGETSFDSQITLNSMDGSAKFQGRVLNSSDGRPASMEELDAVGQFLIKSHVNVSLAVENPKGFCESLDRDNIISNEPGALIVLPQNTSRYNYVWNDGKMNRQLNTTELA